VRALLFARSGAGRTLAVGGRGGASDRFAPRGAPSGGCRPLRRQVRGGL